MFLFFGAVMYLLSITPVKDFLLYPLERIKTDNSTANAVVVLGGGVKKKGVIKAYPETLERLVYGLLLAKKFHLPLIYSGGGIKFNGAFYVKKDINFLCHVFGCKFKIYFEGKSLNTYQNALYTSKLFEKFHLIKNIYLVTSGYHMKRAAILFRYFGFIVHPHPVGFLYEGHYNFWDFFPKMENFYESFKAIHEYFGLLSLKILH